MPAQPSPPAVRRLGIGRCRRSGTAAVEFAVCLPVLVLLVFASLEACSMIFVRQALQTSAYEAVRVAVAGNGTTAEAVSRGLEMLRQRGIKRGNVAVVPARVEDLTAGDRVTVTVTASVDANRVIPKWFFGAGDMSVDCVMLREGRRL